MTVGLKVCKTGGGPFTVAIVVALPGPFSNPLRASIQGTRKQLLEQRIKLPGGLVRILFFEKRGDRFRRSFLSCLMGREGNMRALFGQ